VLFRSVIIGDECPNPALRHFVLPHQDNELGPSSPFDHLQTNYPSALFAGLALAFAFAGYFLYGGPAQQSLIVSPLLNLQSPGSRHPIASVVLKLINVDPVADLDKMNDTYLARLQGGDLAGPVDFDGKDGLRGSLLPYLNGAHHPTCYSSHVINFRTPFVVGPRSSARRRAKALS